MPTGYTAGVQDGKVTTLEEYAWICARGMGALIAMRDEPHDAPIPEAFSIDTHYHDEKIEEANATLDELVRMNPEAITHCAEEAYQAGIQSNEAYAKRKQQSRERYHDMLDQLRDWFPPEPLHSFKDFMVSQLQNSIKFDCGDYTPDAPVDRTPGEWKKATREKALRDLEFYTEERRKEIQRLHERNDWLAMLRSSLK